MKTFVRLGLVIATLSLFGVQTPLLAQAGPLTGNGATVSLAPAVAANGTVIAPLLVDLTGVIGKSAMGKDVAASLGGYQIEVTFDKSRLRLESVTGGTSPEFASQPTFTTLSNANSSGRVVIVAAQAISNGPTGIANVATLKFSAQGAGTTRVMTAPSSLSTAFKEGAGPASIPAKGSIATITLAGGGRTRAIRS